MNRISRFRHELTLLRVELKKVEEYVTVNDRDVEMCQCGTEIILEKTRSPKRIKAVFMVCLMVDKVSRQVMNDVNYEIFKKRYRIPKIKAHAFGGYVDPNWLIYEAHGFDKTISYSYVARMVVHALSEMEMFFESSNLGAFDSWAKTFKQQANEFNSETKNAVNEGYNEYVIQAALSRALSFMKKLID